MTTTEAGSPTADRLRLEIWPITRLIPSPRNARTHSDAQVAEIAGSIKTFGFSNPILIGPDGDIIAGHGRLAAARLLGLDEVPVIVLRGLTELQHRQLVLADNRIAQNAGWNLEMLSLELKDLAALGADLERLGFTAGELARALSPSRTGLTDEDEVPALPDNAVSASGEIWYAGSHRICCGDSTDAAAVAALLAGVRPELMVTDPPYGVGYDATWRHRMGINNSKRSVRQAKARESNVLGHLSRCPIPRVWDSGTHVPAQCSAPMRRLKRSIPRWSPSCGGGARSGSARQTGNRRSRTPNCSWSGGPSRRMRSAGRSGNCSDWHRYQKDPRPLSGDYRDMT